METHLIQKMWQHLQQSQPSEKWMEGVRFTLDIDPIYFSLVEGIYFKSMLKRYYEDNIITFMFAPIQSLKKPNSLEG